jgi:hypothetical protein
MEKIDESNEPGIVSNLTHNIDGLPWFRPDPPVMVRKKESEHALDLLVPFDSVNAASERLCSAIRLCPTRDFFLRSLASPFPSDHGRLDQGFSRFEAIGTGNTMGEVGGEVVAG